MTAIDVRVVEDPAAEVAELLVDVAAAGGHVALSGGSTPRRAYELAAQSDADLSAATLWLGDERVVPLDDERCNLRMVRESLTDRLPQERRPRLMAVDTALGHDAAAAAYETLLRETLGNHPRLDLALLGLGPDGHTASLFPGKPAVQESRRLVVGVPARDAHAAAVQQRARARVPRRRRRQGRRRTARVRHPARRDGARGAGAPRSGHAHARARPRRGRGARLDERRALHRDRRGRHEGRDRGAGAR
jgi:6-phosphogluconolactonase/glucosamine-6-phosphate isomerase/deaminase